jgi:hypothetical protein
MINWVHDALIKAESEEVIRRAESGIENSNVDVNLVKEYCSYDSLNYTKIVRLNKMLRDASASLIRLYAFKNEAIIHAIFVDDLLTSYNNVINLKAPKKIYRSDPAKQK